MMNYDEYRKEIEEFTAKYGRLSFTTEVRVEPTPSRRYPYRLEFQE